MSVIYILIISLILLFIGISLAANNRFITFILRYFFYGSKTSKTLVRFLGILVLTSLVLILLKMYYYAILVNIGVSMIFTFFTIQGRNKAKTMVAMKQQEQELQHRAHMEQRRQDLAKTRKQKIKDLESGRNKPQSVKQMKDKLWNDGSKTNKDIIRDLNN